MDLRQQPVATVSHWEWQLKASCRGLCSTYFFHPDAEKGTAREHRERRAVSICQRCPAIQECRRHALTVPERYGIWGGLTEGERRRAGRVTNTTDGIGTDGSE